MSSSLLATDGYKFSMAEAGWPLRDECFYYTHRRGGIGVVPVDLEAFVRDLLPEPGPDDYRYLADHDYEMGAGFKTAMVLRDRVRVRAIPRGSAFVEREPVFTVAGPSALVSWLEPLALQLNYRIQVATLATTDPEALAVAVARVTCEEQRRIVLETLDTVGVAAPPIAAEPELYHGRVLARVKELVRLVENPNRVFEVGMRAASCLAQHRIALEACKEAGVVRTSNVVLARELSMVPVGTMGHEHVQRYGTDEAAFRAMRDRRPNRSSFLLDTFDTFLSGLPAALELMQESPGRGDSIRYDSGDKVTQYLFACARARALQLEPIHILEDGFDAVLTGRFEELRRQVGVDPAHQFYGYGGTIVAEPSGSTLTRDRVSAVWKLTRTGRTPTMKFANEADGAKESVPGEPVVFRRVTGNGPIGIVGQEGEEPPAGYVRLTGASQAATGVAALNTLPGAQLRAIPSPATGALIETLRRRHFGRRHDP
ncbi:MAG: nicotinate phosphoribosyltransferase [Candidatus Riflebacteria bacterium]|nr:nicotinate phosphoribosyltransferase [Candidatus Riflebacteria bacterium]